jgi:PAS domain S-box-containing protein
MIDSSDPGALTTGEVPGTAGRAAGAEEARAEILTLLLDATTDGIMDWDFRSGIIRYTDRWKLLLGYEPQALVDSPTLWSDLSHPEDLPGMREVLTDHLENYWPFSHTWRMRHENGEWRWVLCRAATLRDEQMQPTRLVAVFSDITDRIRAEQRHRALALAIPDLLLRLDTDGLLADIKPADGELPPGLTLPVVGAPLAAWPAAADWHQKVKNAIRTAAGGNPRATFEAPLAGTDPRRHAEIRVAGTADETVCIVRDVTDHHNIQTQLMQAHKLESIGELAAGIAHEINTPMQYIGDNLAYVQEACSALLAVTGAYQKVVDATTDRPIDGPAREALLALREDQDIDYVSERVPKAIASALEGVGRVARIVRAMKEFSHPGATDKTACDLNQEIETTLTIASNVWKTVANIERRFDPNLPAVACHPGEVNQVLLNLIVNAAHAISDVLAVQARAGCLPQSGKGIITITTLAHDEQVEVRIADTGGGIPEKIRSRIFDPFFTTKEVGRGTGQGLAIARNTIVDKHGGSLHFETVVGAGTTFVIRLPLTTLSTAPADAAGGAAMDPDEELAVE